MADILKRHEGEEILEYMRRAASSVPAGNIVHTDLERNKLSREDFAIVFRSQDLVNRILEMQYMEDLDLGNRVGVEFEQFCADLIKEKLEVPLGGKAAVAEKFGKYERVRGKREVLQKSGIISEALATQLEVIALVRNKFDHSAGIEYFHHLPIDVLDKIGQLPNEADNTFDRTDRNSIRAIMMFTYIRTAFALHKIMNPISGRNDSSTSPP